MTKLNTEVEHIATLVHSDEYEKYLNQVASVYTDRLIFVKRKFAAFSSYELIELPLHEPSSIKYETRWAVVSMIFGALLALSIVLLFLFGSVPDGTRVHVGAFAFVFILAIVLLRGPKRHRLTFIVGDKKYRWESKAGDFKYKLVSTNKIVTFARERDLLVQ